MKNTDKSYYEIVKTIEEHYPNGWGGAAGVILSDGQILTSISPDFPNAGVSLCMETGSYLQAALLKKDITHTLCIVRDNENEKYKVLSPCGICQERLKLWDNNILCTVTMSNGYIEGASDIVYLPLLDISSPYPWTNAYK